MRIRIPGESQQDVIEAALRVVGVLAVVVRSGNVAAQIVQAQSAAASLLR